MQQQSFTAINKLYKPCFQPDNMGRDVDNYKHPDYHDIHKPLQHNNLQAIT